MCYIQPLAAFSTVSGSRAFGGAGANAAAARRREKAARWVSRHLLIPVIAKIARSAHGPKDQQGPRSPRGCAGPSARGCPDPDPAPAGPRPPPPSLLMCQRAGPGGRRGAGLCRARHGRAAAALAARVAIR